MGKIRVRTLGEEETERKQKEKVKKKAEAKKLVKGAKGGERLVAVGPSEEELARLPSPEGEANGGQAKLELAKVAEVAQVAKGETETQKKKSRGARSGFARKKQARSPKYLAVAKLIDKTKLYPLEEALKLLAETHLAKFDETVELHINTIETGISGTTTLPFGSGKEIRVAIATDELIEKIAKSLPATPSQGSGLRGGRGKIDFDVLLAAPAMMPKLAKVAKFLGPRGLMPNPKNKTIANDPEKLAKSFKKGQINFKTELKAPIIHLRVGKLSFGEAKLAENIKTAIEAIKKEKIRNITLKSTMSPGIKVQL